MVSTIRVKQETLEQIDRLREEFNISSRSDVVERAIGTHSTLVDAIKNGGKLYVVLGSGTQVELGL